MVALTVKLKFKSFYVKIKSDKPRNASVKADGTEYVCILFLFARCKHTEIMRTIIKTDTNSLCYSFSFNTLKWDFVWHPSGFKGYH